MRLIMLVLATAMAVAPGFGQEKPGQEKKEAGHEKGGESEGIKVHGHWVLEIKNPDGSLAKRREFENSLAPTGAALLSALLGSAQIHVGGWGVSILIGSGNTQTTLVIGQSTVECQGVSNCIANLTVTSDSNYSTSQPTTIVLSGQTMGSPVSDVINSVQSNVGPCSSGLCYTGVTGYIFTSAPVTGLSVQAGQTITATVTISFS